MPSTPREREQLWAFLKPLDSWISRERRIAILRFLTETVAACPLCELPVRRCDARCLHGDGLAHLACARRWEG